jgi:hypothetical protein
MRTGAIPTIVSYDASAVNIYNATSNLERFENKNMFFYSNKRTGLLCTMLALLL